MYSPFSFEEEELALNLFQGGRGDEGMKRYNKNQFSLSYSFYPFGGKTRSTKTRRLLSVFIRFFFGFEKTRYIHSPFILRIQRGARVSAHPRKSKRPPTEKIRG
jgi:hypothetical protein